MQDCELDTWGSKEPFGSFWLWVAGTAVGNTDATEQLALSFLPLAELVRRSGDRPNARFKGIANVDKFNLVIWIRFGEDHDFDEERWGAHDRETLRREHLRHYEVIPRGYSPYCDGWEAISSSRTRRRHSFGEGRRATPLRFKNVSYQEGFSLTLRLGHSDGSTHCGVSDWALTGWAARRSNRG